MSEPTLPEIGTLASLPTSAQRDVVDTLFEPSASLHDLATALFAQHQQQQRPSYTSYPQFIDDVRSRLSELATSDSKDDRTVLFDILGSHPRLGEKSQNKLSALSRKEQANLRSGVQDEGQNSTQAELQSLNGVYEETFPGLRYVYARALETGFYEEYGWLIIVMIRGIGYL